jgi:hypothetical protein
MVEGHHIKANPWPWCDASLSEAASMHKHPLALDSFFSWPVQPHARFHPAWCSPDNPPIWKGWRDSLVFRVD